jgi:hypothetical protein
VDEFEELEGLEDCGREDETVVGWNGERMWSSREILRLF